VAFALPAPMRCAGFAETGRMYCLRQAEPNCMPQSIRSLGEWQGLTVRNVDTRRLCDTSPGYAET